MTGTALPSGAALPKGVSQLNRGIALALGRIGEVASRELPAIRAAPRAGDAAPRVYGREADREIGGSAPFARDEHIAK